MPSELIHTMIRVLDEERSLDFYRALGFEERGRARVGGDTATVIFLGLPGDGARLELTLNDGRTEPYEVGEGYGHIALVMRDGADAEVAPPGRARHRPRARALRGLPRGAEDLLRPRPRRLPGRVPRAEPGGPLLISRR